MLYDPKNIRTQNMASFRGDDVHFDPDYEEKDAFGVVTYPQRSKTQQQFIDDCDINKIVARADASGVLTHTARGTPQYGDFSQFGDSLHFQNSLNTVIEAENAFMALPAETRKRFSNDPAELLAFLEDPKNQDEAVRLGLASPKPATDNPDPIVHSPPAKPVKPAKNTPEEPQE